MGKAPLILQYLHDHARLICEKRNEKDGPGTWRITPIPDDQRRNIIFHYGSTENFPEFFNMIRPEKELERIESPPLNYYEINLKSLERREMMRMSETKFKKQQSRLTLKRNTQNTNKTLGIFLNGIQSNRILIPKETEKKQIEENFDISGDSDEIKEGFFNSCKYEKDLKIEISPLRNPSLSTSSIYLASYCSNSSDYETNLFNEPDDFDEAQYHHEKDLNREDWFDDSVNNTQSQRQGGFIQRHRAYYHFNSQR